MGNQFGVALQPFSSFIEASDTGYGGHTVEHGMHTAHESMKPSSSITCRRSWWQLLE